MYVGGAPGACETLIDNKGARVLDYDEKRNFSIKTVFFFFFLKISRKRLNVKYCSEPLKRGPF